MAELESQLDLAQKKRPFKLSEAVISDIGRKRKENQDAYAVVHSDRTSLYVVADGMGGARGGGTASAIAVQVLTRHAFDSSSEITLGSLREAIELANKAIFGRSSGDEDLTGMGTTIVALVITDDKALVAHVGDSRLYYVHQDGFEQLTRDHTLVQELVDSGAIQAEDAANHPIAHMLTRSLGPTDAVEVEVGCLAQPIAEHDKFLLCSDGLYNLVAAEEIEAELRNNSPEEAAKKLVDLALERGGTDNVTVQIVEVQDAGTNISDESPSSDAVRIQLSQGADRADIVELAQGLLAAGELPKDSKENEGETQEAKAALDRDSETVEEPPSEGALLSFQQTVEGEVPEEAASTEEPVPAQREESEKDNLFIELSERFEDEEPGEEPIDFSSLAQEYHYTENLLSKIKWVVAATVVLALVAIVYAFYPFHSSAPVILASNRSEAAAPVLATPVPALTAEKVAVEETVQPTAEATAPPVEENEPLFPDLLPDEGMEEASSGESSSEPTKQQVAQILNVGSVKEETNTKSEAAEVPASDISPDLTLFEQIKFQVNDLQLPPPPNVSLPAGDDKEKLNQPIVWENEQLKMARIVSQSRQKPAAAVEKIEAPASKKILSQEEIEKIASRKQEIRAKVGDIDLKVQMLGYGSEAVLRTKRSELEAELGKVTAALAQAEDQKEKTAESLRKWFALKKQAIGRERLKCVDEAATMSEQVRIKKEAYSKASVRYLESVDLWQRNPSDVQAASDMGALGREMQRIRNELEDEVTIAIASGLEEALRSVSEDSVTAENIEQRQVQLNRHIGYLNGFIPLNAARKHELRDNYLKERAALVEELKNLQVDVPDERELELRKLAIASQIASPEKSE